MSKYMFEVCAADLEDVIAAIDGGADRVELCRNLEEDGLTPDYETIKAAVGMARNAGRPFKVMVLVRLRPGDFVYTDGEKELMKRSVADIIDLGVDGVVVGSLTPDGAVDTEWVRQITDMAHERLVSVTFHRAFDHVDDFGKALEALAEAGIDRVLTAGGQEGADKGSDTLSRLVCQADDRIIVMPGGGVRSSNILRLREKTGAKEYHSSCRCTSCGRNHGASLPEVRKIAQLLNE